MRCLSSATNPQEDVAPGVRSTWPYSLAVCFAASLTLNVSQPEPNGHKALGEECMAFPPSHPPPAPILEAVQRNLAGRLSSWLSSLILSLLLSEHSHPAKGLGGCPLLHRQVPGQPSPASPSWLLTLLPGVEASFTARAEHWTKAEAGPRVTDEVWSMLLMSWPGPVGSPGHDCGVGSTEASAWSIGLKCGILPCMICL